MSEFLVYLRLGFEHIADLKGYDHIVFIVALTAIYSLSDWKHVLWLVTAFTVGHSVTLALATLRLLSINSNLVEILIPITIIVVVIVDLQEIRMKYRIKKAVLQDHSAGKLRIPEGIKYTAALIFGLIHGLGFSSFLRAVLGSEESIALPLFAFNVGLELGQLFILFAILIISYLIIHLTPINRRIWGTVISVLCGSVAIIMLLSRLNP